jgi:hypothetical protein
VQDSPSCCCGDTTHQYAQLTDRGYSKLTLKVSGLLGSERSVQQGTRRHKDFLGFDARFDPKRQQ